jgi:hypothetical protein
LSEVFTSTNDAQVELPERHFDQTVGLNSFAVHFVPCLSEGLHECSLRTRRAQRTKQVDGEIANHRQHRQKRGGCSLLGLSIARDAADRDNTGALHHHLLKFGNGTCRRAAAHWQQAGSQAGCRV